MKGKNSHYRLLLEEHFDEIINIIDEEVIISEWNDAVRKLRSVYKEVIDLYMLKINCLYFRATDMKSDKWKCRILTQVVGYVNWSGGLPRSEEGNYINWKSKHYYCLKKLLMQDCFNGYILCEIIMLLLFTHTTCKW